MRLIKLFIFVLVLDIVVLNWWSTKHEIRPYDISLCMSEQVIISNAPLLKLLHHKIRAKWWHFDTSLLMNRPKIIDPFLVLCLVLILLWNVYIPLKPMGHSPTLIKANTTKKSSNSECLTSNHKHTEKYF